MNTELRKFLVACIVALTMVCIVGCLVMAGLGYFTRATRETTVESTPASAVSVAACEGWNTSPGVTQELQPGQTARGDIEVNGQPYYDAGGKGEGTSVMNLSSKPVSIFAEWGSGCEPSTDLKFLVNKDLKDGCGSVCDKARIVTVTDSGTTEQFYTAPLK